MKLFEKLKKLEIRNWMVLVGLICLGVGLWLKAPWMAFTFVGLILIALGLTTPKKT